MRKLILLPLFLSVANVNLAFAENNQLTTTETEITCAVDNFGGQSFSKVMPEKTNDLETTELVADYNSHGQDYKVTAYATKRGLDQKYVFLTRACQRASANPTANWTCQEQMTIHSRSALKAGFDKRWTLTAVDSQNLQPLAVEIIKFTCQLK